MNKSESFLELLRRDGVVQAPDAQLTPLNGGVSCETYLVQDGPERFVVKRALARLKVKADWSADVSRNRHEWEYICYVKRFLPSAVPALRRWNAAGNYFTMEHLDTGFFNWKQLLLAGQASLVHAQQAGILLAQIHRYSSGDAEAMRLFDTTPTFIQLRIEPYLLATSAKHPVLRSLFEAEATRLAASRECLVHGDFSPKNILINGERMVLLDCETAWYGDPAFDLAFMLNHFFLKALWHAPREVGLRSMIDKFWSEYQVEEPSLEIELHTSRLLLMLMLARVDGKSPVEYLNATRQQIVREFVREQLLAGVSSLQVILDSWFRRLAQFEF